LILAHISPRRPRAQKALCPQELLLIEKILFGAAALLSVYYRKQRKSRLSVIQEQKGDGPYGRAISLFANDLRAIEKYAARRICAVSGI